MIQPLEVTDPELAQAIMDIAQHRSKQVKSIVLGTDTVAILEPVTPSHSIGRNDPCLCGSGLKYKRCCLHLN